MQPTPSSPTPRVPTGPSETPPRVDSGQLLRGHRTVEIEHGGQRYQLRVTRENKLILTK